MKILGIDPGFATLGWAVITDKYKIIEYGTIVTPAKENIGKRLLILHKELTEIITKFNPDVVALEQLFFKSNSKSAIDVAKAIGVITLTLSMAEISFYEYTPTQIKYSITGYGRASKEQIQIMVRKIFNIKELPRPDDAADALGVALCHSISN